MKVTQQGSALRLRFVQVGIVVALFVLLAALGVATYAWFTNNAAVNTNSVSVHSDDSSLVVDLGDAASGSWSSSGDVALSSNSPDPLTLYPVSTFDLNGFAECTHNNDAGEAVHFEQAADGEHFYHGWIDLRARVIGSGAGNATGAVNLYLGDSLVPSDTDPELLRAARVGLKFSRAGQVVKTCYFALDGSGGGHRGEHPATRPGLDGYADGMLLGWQNGSLACANDGSEDFNAYLMGSGDSSTRPQNALLTMDQGTEYRLDVYYYIEGTDPDSADYLYGDVGVVHLNLFAVLDGQGA